jgi:hypothetical protein
MKFIHPSLMHASECADAGILPSVWKLLRLRLRITYNGFRHAKLRDKIRIIFVWALLLGFAYFLLSASRWLLSLVHSPEFVQFAGDDLRGILASIPTLTLTALFIGTLLTSFGVLLQALYLSGDMDFLLATPVPIRAVFIAKLLQAVLPNFALFSLFGIPILFGLGISNGYHVSYYPLVILLMIFLALAAAGLHPCWSCWFVRVLPPRQRKSWVLSARCSHSFVRKLAPVRRVWREYQFFRSRITGLSLLQHALAAIELGRPGLVAWERSLAARGSACGQRSGLLPLRSGLPSSPPNACIIPAGPGCKLSPAKRVRHPPGQPVQPPPARDSSACSPSLCLPSFKRIFSR